VQPVRYILRRFDEDRLGGLEDILSENKKNKDWREIFGALSRLLWRNLFQKKLWH